MPHALPTCTYCNQLYLEVEHFLCNSKRNRKNTTQTRQSTLGPPQSDADPGCCALSKTNAARCEVWGDSLNWLPRSCTGSIGAIVYMAALPSGCHRVDAVGDGAVGQWLCHSSQIEVAAILVHQLHCATRDLVRVGPALIPGNGLGG